MTTSRHFNVRPPGLSFFHMDNGTAHSSTSPVYMHFYTNNFTALQYTGPLTHGMRRGRGQQAQNYQRVLNTLSHQHG